MADADALQPLLDSGRGYWRAGPRPRVDAAWRAAFLGLLALAAGVGVVAVVKFNPDAVRHAGDPSWCPPHTLTSTSLTKRHPPSPTPADTARLARGAAAAVAASLAAGVAAGAGGLRALKSRPAAFLGAAVAAQVALPAAGGLLAAANGLPAAFSLSLALAAAATALAAYVWRDQLALCGRLLGVASHAVLATSPALVATSLGVTLGGGALATAYGVLAAAGAGNGALVSDGDGGCVWRPSALSPVAVGVCGLAAVWVAATTAAARTFVAAGAAAQWFSAPPDAPAVPGAARAALAAAAGPQLGTVAAAGAVSVAADALRAAVNAATTDENGQPSGLLAALAGSLVSGALAVLQYLTRFAVVAAALAGAPLLASGRAATTLLQRVALSAVAVWYVPPLVLHTAAAAAAVVWGGAVAAASKAAVASPTAPSAHYAVGAAAGATLFLALNWLASLLLSVVDALFFLYALDRAAGAGPTRPDVADVMGAVPCGAGAGGKRVPPSALDEGAV